MKKRAERYKKREPRKNSSYIYILYLWSYILDLTYSILYLIFYIIYLISIIFHTPLLHTSLLYAAILPYTHSLILAIFFIVISRLLLIIRKPPSIRLLYPWFYIYYWCTINISNIITWSLGQPFTHRRANSGAVYIIWIWIQDIIRGPDQPNHTVTIEGRLDHSGRIIGIANSNVNYLKIPS